MNLESTEKRKLLVTVAATLAVSVGSWLLLAAPATSQVNALQKQVDSAQAKWAETQNKAKSLPRLKDELSTLEARLNQLSAGLINGDQYLWVIQNFSRYEVPNKLEFTGYDQPIESPWGLPGADRLRAASFLVKGIGSYQELGKFTASLENDFPGLRFRTMTITPAEPKDAQKVAFVLDIVGLVSPEEPAPLTGMGFLTRN